jgi:hypothetical protein
MKKASDKEMFEAELTRAIMKLQEKYRKKKLSVIVRWDTRVIKN